MIYSYKKSNPDNLHLGATVYEDDKPLLNTAHKEGMHAGDHDDLAEYTCSALFIVGVGEEREVKEYGGGGS